MSSPRIYVACLASYNSGTLHGAWIDANQDEDAIQGEIAAMLAESKHAPAEDWAIHDYDGFEGLDLGEHASIEDIALHGGMVAEYGGAWVAYVSNVGARYASDDDFNDHFAGEHDSPEAYAEQVHDDMGTDLGPLAAYVDWERYARDLNGYTFIDSGNRTVYVFTP